MIKQLNLFSKNVDSKKIDSNKVDSRKSDQVFIKSINQTVWQLYTDGACRNNPGPSSIGFCLKKNGKTICEQGFYIGKKTNNQAEYSALLVGIYFAKEFMKTTEELAIYSDSQLLVRQMSGQYRVKDATLKILQKLGFDLLQGYKYSFSHVYREQNTRADELANRGLDKKIPLPKKIIDILPKY